MARRRGSLGSRLGLGNLVDNVIEKIMEQFLEEGSDLIELILDRIKESDLIDGIIEEVTESVIDDDDWDDEDEERVLDMRTDILDDDEFGIE